MAQTFDVESCLLAIKARLYDASEGLNVQLAAIDAEKAATDVSDYGRAITLAQLAAGAVGKPGPVFLLTASQYASSYDPFVAITIEDYATDELGGVHFKAGIKITIADKADGLVDIRALRYIRALRQVFEVTRWTSGLKYQRIKQLETVGYLDTENNQSWREIGIALETAFSSY